jgi:hypothetical protein
MAKNFNNWGKIADSIKPACKAVVKKTAFDAEGQIKAQITANDQVDTGFMRNSVYVVTSDSSTYKGGEKALPEVAKPSSETEAYVAVAAEYAIHQNYLFQAFFEPGMERVRPGFDAAMRAIKAKMEEAANGS